jgi:hypothetical protein
MDLVRTLGVWSWEPLTRTRGGVGGLAGLAAWAATTDATANSRVAAMSFMGAPDRYRVEAWPMNRDAQSSLTPSWRYANAAIIRFAP